MIKTNSTNHVLVVGAGAAGIAAAIAVAELGTQVSLVERYGFVGGLASSAMVGTICGLYYRHPTTPIYAVQGFARQFTKALQQKMQTQPTVFAKGLHFLPYQISAFQQQATESLQQAGVKLMLHCSVTGLTTANDNINTVSLQCQNEVIEMQPSAVIDCSGHAQISTLAGIEKITEPHYQAAAFVFQVSGLPEMESRVLGLNLIRWLSKGIQAGDLDPTYKNLSIVPGSVKNGIGLLKLGLPSLFTDTPGYLTQAELEARAQSVKLVDYLQQSERLLSNLTLLNMAPQIGIRSAARCKGIEQLDENQVLNCIKPENGVAIGAWPIEYWGGQAKPDMQYFPENDCYWIPAGTLVSDSLNNLFFAGRHLSATEQAAASARVIGTCLSTGYAAGMLAAELVQQGHWQTAIKKIQLKQIFAAEA